MSPSTHYARRHPDNVPLGQARPMQADAALAESWLAHVEAGRIGGHLAGPDGSACGCAAQPQVAARLTATPPELLAVHRANEVAVLGHAPSFPPHTIMPAPAPLPRRSGWGR